MEPVHLDWRQFRRDVKRFQGRADAYAESVADGIARGGWRREKAGVFHVWHDPKDLELYVLDGHSRLAGLERLDATGDAPHAVFTEVHAGLSEREAVALAKELNASRRGYAPCELARLTREAVEEDGAAAPLKARLQVLAARFAGSTASELERNLPLAWLPTNAAHLVDSEQFPLVAARALGRFIRDTNLPPAPADTLAVRFCQEGMNVADFLAYLEENRGTLEKVAQDDLFGSMVSVQFQGVQRIQRALTKVERRLDMIRKRRDVFAELERIGAGATPEQAAVLVADREEEPKAKREAMQLRMRFQRAMRFGGVD